MVLRPQSYNPANEFGLDAAYSGMLVDSFGHLRTASPQTIGEYKHLWNKIPLFVDEEVIGTGSSVHSLSSVIMSVAEDGDVVIRKSLIAHPYQAGKSSRIQFTCDSFHLQAGVVKRIGYFSSDTTSPWAAWFDGLFLESDGDGGEHYFCVAHKVGGVTRYARSTWDDPVDGTTSSPSRHEIDFADRNIFDIDFQWLGVGRARLALSINGIAVVCHEVNHANNGVGVYMVFPAHPIRYEIRSTGGAGLLTMICSTVIVNGRLEPVGLRRVLETGVSAVTLSTAGTLYALLGIRLGSAYLNGLLELVSVDALASTNDGFRWEVRVNPTIVGSPSWVPIADSAAEGFVGSASITVAGGTVIAGGNVSQQAQLIGPVENYLRLGSTLAGVSGTAVLVIRSTGNNLGFRGQLTWREYF